MGGTVQEVLQRRDGQKGYGVIVKRASLPALLLLSYAGLILNLPLRKGLIWFPLSILISVVYLFLYAVRRQRKYTVETFSSLGLIFAGVIQVTGKTWLHLLYIPYLMTLSLYFGPAIILPVSLTVPLFEATHLFGGNSGEEIALTIVTVLSSIAVSFTFSRVKRERDRIHHTFETLKKEAEATDPIVSPDSLSRQSHISQHLSSVNRADDEIREILSLAQHLLSGDAAHLFVLRGEVLQLRCSTNGARAEDIPEEHLLRLCLHKRQAPPGHAGLLMNGAAQSYIATPIIDGNYTAGVLTVQGGTLSPCKESDLTTLTMLSQQITKILQRQRTYAQLHREHVMLRKLKDGGSRLMTSLKVDDLAQSLIHAVYGIVSLDKVSIALFVPRGEGFELIRQIGFTLPEKSIVDVKNTRMGLISKSREPDYISDLSSERNPVLPFKAGGHGSVLMLPLSYETESLGVLVVASPRTDAIRPYEIELLKVLAFQASSSLANAQLHAEIERLAVTDGLTGLFNHRAFQGKLAEKFRELRRFSETLSLMLIDIDFFKKINDAYGHPAGDEVLRGVAGIIRKAMRDIDIPARYGGEEFAAILIKTDHEGAFRVAERVRRSVMEETFTIDAKTVQATVSIGIAIAPHEANSKEDLISKADQALYHAKKSGRNRCVLWRDIA